MSSINSCVLRNQHILSRVSIPTFPLKPKYIVKTFGYSCKCRILTFHFCGSKEIVQARLNRLKTTNEKPEELAAKLDKKAVQLINFYIVHQGLTYLRLYKAHLSLRGYISLSIAAFLIYLLPMAHLIIKSLRARVEVEYNSSEQERLQRKTNCNDLQTIIRNQYSTNSNSLQMIIHNRQSPM